MPIAYEIHPANGILIYVATGALTSDDVVQTMAAVANDKDFDPSYAVVMISDDRLQTHDLDYAQIREISSAGNALLGRGDNERPSYQAIVCPEGMQKIFANFFAAVVESDPANRVTHKVCKTFAEVEQWTGCSCAGILAIELALREDYEQIRELYG